MVILLLSSNKQLHRVVSEDSLMRGLPSNPVTVYSIVSQCKTRNRFVESSSSYEYKLELEIFFEFVLTLNLKLKTFSSFWALRNENKKNMFLQPRPGLVLGLQPDCDQFR